MNLLGAVPADEAAWYWVGEGAAPLAGLETVWVVGSGGRAHWERLQPVEGADPIDRRGQAAIEAAAAAVGVRALGRDVVDRFDLRRLAVAAGLGVRSPQLELLIHPVYGPWISIRGLVVGAEVVAQTGPLGVDLCGPCAKPCVAACPAGAVQAAGAWSFGACVGHRALEREHPEDCADGCRSRRACVVGREHAYGGAEERHRHRALWPQLKEWAE